MDDGQAKRIDRLTSQPLFPFTGDFELKELSPLMDAEPVRSGESDDQPCFRCSGNGSPALWRNDRFLISAVPGGSNPVGLFVETVDCIDFDGFDADMAAEVGVISWHLTRIVEARDDVGRVHLHRFADGAKHYHLWVLGRPARQIEQFGWGNIVWAQLLPSLDAELRDANHRDVLTEFAARHGGELLI